MMVKVVPAGLDPTSQGVHHSPKKSAGCVQYQCIIKIEEFRKSGYNSLHPISNIIIYQIFVVS